MALLLRPALLRCVDLNGYWSYRFEAYVPPANGKLGYYVLPMLRRDDVVGWVNIKRKDGDLDIVSGFAKSVEATTGFKREFSLELIGFAPS